MTLPDIIKQLVARFEEHHETYRSGKYKETQLHREFLDPFLEAFGRDGFNKVGIAQIYKDVIHKDSLEIKCKNKAQGYAFRVGGHRRFPEARKSAVKIEMNIHPAFQLHIKPTWKRSPKYARWQDIYQAKAPHKVSDDNEMMCNSYYRRESIATNEINLIHKSWGCHINYMYYSRSIQIPVDVSYQCDIYTNLEI
jgi:hypothetical protein